MLRKLLTITTTFFCLLFLQLSAAALPLPAAPTINAKAYVLMDAQSGAIIAAHNATDRLPPASLTKLMTLYLTFKALQAGTIHLNDDVQVSEKAWKTGGSRMFLRVGTSVTVEQLIQGVIVDSGNDACVTLAELIGGNEDGFVVIMNAEATTLGMQNTHYVDSDGLNEPNHYSTAQDLAVLTRAIINNFPADYHYFNQRWFAYGGIKQPNRNRLLWHVKNADGLKTGHTDQAGYCLIGSATQNGMRLISVILGAPSDNARTEDSQALLAYGFRFFTTKQFIAGNTTLDTPSVYLGADKTTPVGLLQPLYITTPISQNTTAISQSIAFTTMPLRAPLAKGQSVGTVMVMLDNKPLAEAPLVALADNPQGNILRRFCDHIALGFSALKGASK